MRWQQIQTDPMLFGPDLYGRVIDDAWIIQEKHGPFNIADAPKGLRNPAAKQISYDHWNTIFTPDLGGKASVNGGSTVSSKIADGSAGPSSELESMIRNFQKSFGEGKWKEAEMKELEVVKKVLGSNDLEWEDLTPWTKAVARGEDKEGKDVGAKQHQWAGKEKWEEF